jgi:hypothetical protein
MAREDVVERDDTVQSYLVRLWRDHTGTSWRALVTEVAQPEDRRQFASLDDLFAFLLARTEEHVPRVSENGSGAGPNS